MAEFRMPVLGADMTEGTLLEWHVKPGQLVHRGEIVAVVDTDKAAIEVEVFEDGVVDELLVAPGTRVPVGTPLARLSVAGAQAATPPAATEAPAPATPAPATPPAAVVVPPAPVVVPPAPVVVPPAPVVAPPASVVAPPAPVVAPPAPVVVPPVAAEPPVESPLVRHLAHQRGIDLASVHGTGGGGLITRADVDAVSVVVRPRLPSHGVRASPLARRRATQMGIDLATVTGTGPGGAVTLADVDSCHGPVAATAPLQAPPAAAVVGPAPAEPATTAADRNLAMRRAIGQLMARSKREVPHYYLSATIDLSQAMAWLHDVNATRPVADRLVAAALLLKATALATRAVPEVNGFWVDDRLEVSEHVHLGVAVSLRPAGLVAPAILDADTLDLDTLMARLRDVVGRARVGRLRQQEMTAGTLTVTNLGDTGVDAVYGVIYPPQVALVGFGRVAERPWAHNGLLGVRPSVTATLSADHRATDGHRGSRYLSALEDILQNPEGL